MMGRFGGNVNQARLYLDGTLGVGAESLMWEIEDVKGQEARTSLHFHIVVPSSPNQE